MQANEQYYCRRRWGGQRYTRPDLAVKPRWRGVMWSYDFYRFLEGGQRYGRPECAARSHQRGIVRRYDFCRFREGGQR